MSERSKNITATGLTVRDVFILQSASSDEGAHGYAIGEALGDNSRLTGHIYRRLGLLAENGYLEGVKEEKGLNPGLPRTTYRVTDAGQMLLNEAMSYIVPVTEQDT